MTEYICELENFDIPGNVREEVVRCCDCEHFIEGDADVCMDDICTEFNCQIEPDGFCAWASRSES